MAAHGPRKRLALDSNLVLDLAAGADFAHAFREVFQGRGYTLHLPPTVLGELHENFLHGPTLAKRELARVALLTVRVWGLNPFDLNSVESAIAERFAARLGELRLMPREEFNDALILAETSLAGIPLLVTSDKHLLDMEVESLALALNEADLSPVHPAHPKALLKALR